MEYMESNMQDVYDGQFEEERRISEQLEKGFIGKDLEPIKCFECGHEIFKDTIKSIDAGHMSEMQRDCDKCGQQNGYWAYGNWQV
ncbi:MAG: hypothetical protein JKX76_03450 [Colwellia sp.]|nr:hypothetical protein [Colwellia sp.]